jgi:hypothetical protein
MSWRERISASKASNASTWTAGYGSKPSLSSSMPIEDEFTSSSLPQREVPACHARLRSSTSW